MFIYDNQTHWHPQSGHQQSPLNLAAPITAGGTATLPFQITAPYRLHLETDDHTTIKVLGEGTASIFNRPFQFIQLHFHCPSEHLIKGQPSALEIHLVHQNTIGQLCVVALMVNQGPADTTLQMLIDQFSAGHEVPLTLMLSHWAPQAATGYHYLGSLTTPPLTEGVEWLVITNSALTVSVEQVQWFKTHFGSNQRQPQNRADRPIIYYGA